MRRFWRRPPDNRDLDDEILAHLSLEAKQRIDEGERAEDAQQAARRAFGSVAFAKEAMRETWGMGWLDAITQDLKYAVRGMRKAPAFTLVAIVTLAIGIGANTAVFSVIDAALLRPLPFPDANQLVRISSTRSGQSLGGPSVLDMRDMAAAAHSFEGMLVYDRWRKNVSLGGTNDSEETTVGLVPGSYFDVLRIKPMLGRVFTPDEGVFGNHFVAAIGAHLWRTRFAADPRVLGRTVRINGEPYSIVAVMPDVIPSWMDRTNAPIAIWTPRPSAVALREDHRGDRGNLSLGRLAPGVSIEQARAELTTIAARLSREHSTDAGVGVAIDPLADTRAGPVRPVLLMLCGAVAMVLLIACTNVASLLIARNSTRSRELAVRAALGAARPRLVRQLLVETLSISIVGGLAGLGLAAAAGAVLARARSSLAVPYTTSANALPQFWPDGLDLRVLAFTAAVSIVTAVVFGLAPAFTGTRVPLVDVLKEGGRTGTEGAGRQRVRRMLVIAQVALSLVLLSAAALLVQTMIHLGQQRPGFRTDHLLLAHVFIPPARYPNPDAIATFCDRLGARVRTIPGVLDATITTGYPPSMDWRQWFTVPGLAASQVADVPSARFVASDSRYIRTLGVTLAKGRDFDDRDTSENRTVAIVNEEFVRRYLPDGDPIGREIQPGPPIGVAPVPLEDFGGATDAITIVGVVRNFMNDGVAKPPAPQLLALFRQIPGLNFGFKDIVVRTSVSPESVVPAMSRELKSLDADIPLGEIRTMDAHMSNETADARFTTVLLGLFAALGIILAIVGAYGVVSYLVAQRTQELGVRLALGASRGDILRLVLRYGMTMGLAGVAIGVAGALAVRQSLAGLLYGIGAADPLTLVGSSVCLLSIVVAATAIPAARAMRIDPVGALRRD